MIKTLLKLEQVWDDKTSINERCGITLALPLIISGIRLSSVYVISWATCELHWCRWFGDLVFNGLNLYEPPMIISAAILVTCLALLIDFLLSLVEKWAVPKGLKVSR